ncbi:MAG: phosphatase PAP2 family protein [Deltaproteobacteria bacterium]|nr:phosphatase PAP2 family protein [Deltaproteobacteria bacterium]
MLFVTLAVLALGRPAVAAEDEPARVFPGPFDHMARHFAGGFLDFNLSFHIAAVAATATMTTHDTDLEIHRYFRDHPDLGRIGYPIIVAGVAGPVLLFGGLHIAGRATQNPETVGAAYAVFQSVALTLGYVTLLKLVTGRPAPRDDYIPSLAEDDEHLARKFRPGVYRGGIVSGWPSGHVAVTTAMLSALAFYYPKSWLLKAALLVCSAGMMFGVSSFQAGGMHWASDAVAGALMAFPIGMSTGRGMRNVVDRTKPGARSAWFVAPSLRPEAKGLTIGRFF